MCDEFKRRADDAPGVVLGRGVNVRRDAVNHLRTVARRAARACRATDERGVERHDVAPSRVSFRIAMATSTGTLNASKRTLSPCAVMLYTALSRV